MRWPPAVGLPDPPYRDYNTGMNDRSNPSAASVIVTALLLICVSVVAFQDQLLLPITAAAFAAFCVWLTVRIVNRRERWANWTAGCIGCAAIVAAIGYVLDLIFRWIPRVQ